MVTMIKAIIFDCFGVLTKDWWREFCSTLPPGEITQKAHELNHKYDAGELKLKDFVGQIAELTGRQSDEVEKIFASPVPEKNNVLLGYIRELKSKYKIGLISNVGTNWIRDEFLTADELALFDDMTLSFETGVTKPHPEMYKTAAERLGVKLEEAVFTDDIESYVSAAEAIGMKSIVYKDFNQFKSELEKILTTDANN
jgi:HAD superfamily hydrolase (TIGR01549 family)